MGCLLTPFSVILWLISKYIKERIIKECYLGDLNGYPPNHLCTILNTYTYMIYYKSNYRNFLTDLFYLNETATLISNGIFCPICATALICYGFYKRRIFVLNNTMFKTIKVHRLYCKSCKKTHALLPEDSVTYSPFFLKDIILFLDLDEEQEKQFLINNPTISSCTFHFVLNKLNAWASSNSISILSSKISELLSKKLNLYIYQHKDCSIFYHSI